MGRRSRKRSLSDPGYSSSSGEGLESASTSRAERDAERRRRRAAAAASDSARSSGSPSRRRATRERPRAPWGSFPLSELVVALALIMGLLSFLVQGRQGTVLLIAAFALGSLAGLELAIREHFAGYRSHSSLLAACCAFAVGGLVVLLVPGPASRVVTVVVGVLAFAIAFWSLRGTFKRRSGGLGFR